MSNNANCGRPWTPYEDDLLKAAVAIYGDNTEKWKAIAFLVPGRTNKACRKRWLHSLSPSVKKSAWTSEEDQLLLSLFEKYPNKWSRIAREIPGRTDDACSKRYREALDPNLKKDEWTEDEERHLLDALMRHGGPTNPRWVLVGQELRRSSLGCRNRWRLLERKKRASTRRGNSADGLSSFEISDQQNSTDLWILLAESGSSSDWEAVLNSLGVPLENSSGPEANHDFRFDASLGERNEVSHRAVESVSTEPQTTVNHRAELPGGAHVGIFSQDPPVTTSFSSTSSDVGIETQTNQCTGTTAVTGSSAGNNISDYSFDVRVPDSLDYGDSRDSDSFCAYDVDAQISRRSEENRVRETSEEPHHAPETPGNAQTSNGFFTHETENLGSLGTLAQAASTLSPSPLAGADTGQAQQAGHSIVLPPRKRRRPATYSIAYAGMNVISDVSGRPRSEPKLSSSLPVAGDPSILAYVCGQEACLPAGTSESTSCYSTSGELLNHYKDKHMDDAGTSSETPFRCGLTGCNKGWKSINGLQYHLQISKVHYQLICSRAASTPRQNADGTSTASTVDPTCSSDNVPRGGAKRTHKCPHPGCLKEYKQLSGLRYHLLHGHPKNIPTQFNTVPPRIAEQLGISPETLASSNSLPV
ncbi:hypothetical protein ACEPAH_265 [Sanghuangporus vaninii]